ncbi:hypothetical protein ACFO5Q_04605 [Kordiimonas lipolytica]|uniref:FecR protein domain-containing protein n=1 Tax=Kordiimonas lipolytica TaxID=1662421 RepID=A0ABV8U7E0_9PROT|nr:hypothetical protein [Kordiimonas lipolytica]
MVLELSGDDVERIVKNKFQRLLLPLVLIALPVIISLAILSIGWDISFSVTARTEVITIDAAGEALPEWTIKDARLEEYTIDPSVDGGMAPDIRQLSGTLAIGRGAYVRVEYAGRDFVYIDVSSSNTEPDTSIATFRDGETGTSEFIRDGFSLRLSVKSDGSKVLLPIGGVLTVGDIVHLQGAADQYILQEGSVEGVAEEAVSDGRFVAVEAEVDPGDVISFWNAVDDPATSIGFLEFRHGSSMLAQILGNAAWVKVDRLGSDGYKIQPTLWDRVSKDQFFQKSALIYSGLVPIFLSLLIYWSRTKIASRSAPRPKRIEEAKAKPEAIKEQAEPDET